jgi:type VI secretion system FHA domain protein
LDIPPPPLQGEEALAFARGAGQLLRTLSERLMLVLGARASFKRELRLESTRLKATENNPFKLAGSAPEALQLLLLGRDAGFLAPDAAAAEALDDILAHETALIAGFRAALHSLLQRFDPAALERRLQAEAGLGALLPVARKARYWELLAQTYAEASRDADEGFARLFAEALNQAYEAQIQSFRGGPRSR